MLFWIVGLYLRLLPSPTGAGLATLLLKKNRAMAPGLALGQAEVVLASTTSPLETLEGRAKIVDLDHMAMGKSTCCR